MTDSTLRNSTYNSKNGRYVIGGKTETSAKFVEWWERSVIQPDISDFIYVLEEKYAGRPDSLAHAFYGDVGLWWVICQYNGILDPDVELVTGRQLLMPSQSKLDNSYKGSGKLGGIPSTRLDR
jgi:hypothetical protein